MRSLALSTVCVALAVAPALAAAQGYERPVPQPQSATAEVWFALASIALIAALAAVQMLISRR